MERERKRRDKNISTINNSVVEREIRACLDLHSQIMNLHMTKEATLTCFYILYVFDVIIGKNVH